MQAEGLRQVRRALGSEGRPRGEGVSWLCSTKPLASRAHSVRKRPGLVFRSRVEFCRCGPITSESRPFSNAPRPQPFLLTPDPRWTASSAMSPCCHPPGAAGKGDGGSSCAGGYARWLGTVRFGTREDGRAAQGQARWVISVPILQVELAASSGAGLRGLTHGGGGQSRLCERGPGRLGWSWDPPATGDLLSREETGLQPGLCPGAELDAALSLQEKRLFGGAGAGSIR